MLVNKEKQKNDRLSQGFSLLETVLVITLLGLVTIPLLGFFGKTIAYLLTVDTREKAVLLARDRMEELKTLDFDKLEDGREYQTVLKPVGYPEYRRTVEVHTIKTDKLKEVKVRIFWDSAEEQIEIKTRITGR